MLVFPNAKINLGLNVVRKREDGYHDIETLFVPVFSLCDILELRHSDSFEVRVLNAPIRDTLCSAAYALLRGKYDLPPVRINLYKNIPSGAGLGGGSSDAAFTLMALDSLFGLHLSKEELCGYAAAIGSDCPFFIYNRPMLASGRGEVLSPYDFPLDESELRIYPQDVFVSTKEAYAGITPTEPRMHIEQALKLPFGSWKDNVVNDFEKSVFEKHPSLAFARQRLYDEGAGYAAMSGSGSALFTVNRV